MGRGSSKTGSGGGLSYIPQVEKTLNRIEKQTANLKKEQYRVIDENGNVVFQKQGFNDRVEMTVGDKRQYLDGSTTIHNHPQIDEGLGGPMSPNDLSDFGYGAREIVIASNEGTYRLRNLKYGTPESHDGWRPLQNELQNLSDSQSSVDIIRQSNALMAKTKISKKMSSISDKWVKRRAEGASESELKALGDQFTSLQKEYKTQLGQLRRKLELQPYHDLLKKNAKKYGFEYVYPKGIY